MWKMLESIPRSEKKRVRFVYYCAVYLFCANQAGFSNKSAIHNSRLIEASDREFCPSRMGKVKSLKHQSKLLVLAQGELADELVDLGAIK